MNELSDLKYKFRVDEIVLATDNAKGGYWRSAPYPIYKGHRKKGREASEFEWGDAFVIFDEIKETLKNDSSFKMISIPRVEGDDIMFVLSEYLSLQNNEVILHSLDHDTVYNLKHPGVKWYRHVKTSKKPGSFQDVTPGEILSLELEHVIQGDAGDNIKNVKSFSRFSKRFKSLHPDKCEIELYDKRFKLDELFEATYGESAYDHPRYGAKMFLKSKKTIEEFLRENPIYKQNYALNRQIALPEGIPQTISASIIDNYNSASTTKNSAKLQSFFMNNGCFELIGKLGSF